MINCIGKKRLQIVWKIRAFYTLDIKWVIRVKKRLVNYILSFQPIVFGESKNKKNIYFQVYENLNEILKIVQ